MPSRSRKSKRNTDRRKKQRGGVSFNDAFSASTLPSSSYYLLNSHNNDPISPSAIVDSRNLGCSTAQNAIVFGGKKGRKTRRRRATKKTKKRRVKRNTHRRVQKGGASILGFSYLTGLSTADTSLPLAFGSSAGTNYVKDMYLAKAPTSNALTATSPISTLA